MKILLKPSKTVRKERLRGRSTEVATSTAWLRSEPFVVNPRGILTHRVMHVTAIFWSRELSHYHADYLCGNGCNIDMYKINDVLVADPPKDRLLCERCELIAIKDDLPSGDTLAGRHVHRGILVPVQTCCKRKS